MTGHRDDAPVVISACLLGLSCRYDGGERAAPAALAALTGRAVIPVCPEVAAGLGVPRAAIRFAHADVSRVVDERRGVPSDAGADVAAPLVTASEALVRRAVDAGAREAVLKARSPSCGVHRVTVGSSLQPGRGVFAELLARRGVALRTDEDVAAERGGAW